MILFNGEIYNHGELRKKLELDGVEFLSNHSDTEVLLNGLSKYGVKFINELIGHLQLRFLILIVESYF